MREYTDSFLVRFKPGDRDIVRRKMKEAGINYVYQTVFELTYGCLIRLLGK